MSAPGGPIACSTPEAVLIEGNQDRIPAERQGSLAGAHPLTWPGAPQDVVAAAFIASDAAWISGVVVGVAGGAALV